MCESSHIVQGICVLEYPNTSPLLDNDRAVNDLIGEASANSAAMVVVPASRFPPEFFQLRTQRAGSFLQKFVNYRLRLAIVGELPLEALESESLQAFIREANRGDQIWFVANANEARQRLASLRTWQELNGISKVGPAQPWSPQLG